jgi:hypothetical protein
MTGERDNEERSRGRIFGHWLATLEPGLCVHQTFAPGLSVIGFVFCRSCRRICYRMFLMNRCF